MAQTKKKTATKKNATKKSTQKKTSQKKGSAKEQTFYEKYHALFIQIYAVLTCAYAVFLALSLFSSLTGTVGGFFRQLTLGLFGGIGYAMPLVLFYIGIHMGMTAENRKYLRTNIALFLALIFAGVILHLFVVDSFPSKNIIELFNYSYKHILSGGCIGGFITACLNAPLGKAGIAVIFGAVLIISVILLFDTTVDRMVEAVKGLFQRENGKEDTEDDSSFTLHGDGIRDYEEAFPKTPRKTRKQIDFDIDSDKPDGNDLDAIFAKDKFKTDGSKHVFKGDDSFDGLPATEEPLTSSLEPPKITKQELALEEKKVKEQIESEAEAPVKKYIFPPLTLLTPDRQGTSGGTSELQLTAEKIVSTLKSFGVETQLTDVAQGPTVTRYELSPKAGVKISKITGLADDIALSLAASGVRIEAPIPGKAAVGIEVPNKTVKTVYLRSLIESDTFKNAKSKLSFCLGKDLGGDKIIADIAKMPHMLIAGSTGSGKSVCINSLVVSILYNASPEDVKLIMIDPKVVELGVYNGIPHLMLPVVTDPKKASGTLAWAVGEMTKRYQLFAENNVRNLQGYNALCDSTDDMKKLPQIVIIIDELAELMMVSPHEVEDSINRLAALARAAGMHLVVATQRPSVDVITGVIKANIPTRIAFSVSSQVDSRTILDMGGAEKLIGRGDMLYCPIGAPKPIRVQGCFISDKEIEGVVNFIKKQGEAKYDDSVMEEIDKCVRESDTKGKKGSASSAESDSDEDSMLDAAIEVVVECGQASTSLLQRRLKLGYARAARIVDQMEERGIVGPSQGSKPREVRITKTQLYEMRMRQDAAAESVDQIHSSENTDV